MTIERHRIKGREGWLKLRKKDITASDVAAICGVHPKRTPMTVYAAKMGALADEDNNIMRRGRWFEPAIVAALADERPDLKVQQPKLYLRDPDLRIGATLDFMAVDEHDTRGVIEGKVVAKPEFLKHWVDNGFEEEEEKEDGYGEIPAGIKLKGPIWYELQNLTQAKLAESDWAMLAPLVVDTWSANIYPVEVPIVETAWDFVKERVADFWARFDAGQPPDLTPGLDEKALAALYPSDDRSALDLSDDPRAAKLLEEWERVEAILKTGNERLKPHEDRVKEIKTEFKALLGPAALARLPGCEISWKTQSRKAVAATSFRVMRKKRVS